MAEELAKSWMQATWIRFEDGTRVVAWANADGALNEVGVLRPGGAMETLATAYETGQRIMRDRASWAADDYQHHSQDDSVGCGMAIRDLIRNLELEPQE